MRWIPLLLCLCVTTSPSAEPDAPKKTPDGRGTDDKIREIAGTAEVLRDVPKKFGKIESVDSANRRVRLHLDGDAAATDWPLLPDAEIKVHGWWGRLDQLTAGDRVWVWFKPDRKKRPTSILVLADELSEQDIHAGGLKLVKREDDKLTYTDGYAKQHEWTVPAELQIVAKKLEVGKPFYLQTVGKVRLLDVAGFEELRNQQKTHLAKRWESEGLPGTLTVSHISGEVELMLDHEAMRWSRWLKPGDEVSFPGEPPIKAVVRHVKPWREKTQVRLVVKGLELVDLDVGQRIRVKMPAPPKEIQDSPLPTDVDRARTREERIDWFLASIYCTCPVKGDRCTGMFYSLASCNPNACGMPNAMRKEFVKKLDAGKTDRAIFEEFLKLHGPELTRPHLLP